MHHLAKAINTMRAWVNRREEVHKGWTQDELWQHIKSSWPNMNAQDQEEVFQQAYKQRRT